MNVREDYLYIIDQSTSNSQEKSSNKLWSSLDNAKQLSNQQSIQSHTSPAGQVERIKMKEDIAPSSINTISNLGSQPKQV
jgi:hypothetical protein